MGVEGGQAAVRARGRHACARSSCVRVCARARAGRRGGRARGPPTPRADRIGVVRSSCNGIRQKFIPPKSTAAVPLWGVWAAARRAVPCRAARGLADPGRTPCTDGGGPRTTAARATLPARSWPHEARGANAPLRPLRGRGGSIQRDPRRTSGCSRSRRARAGACRTSGALARPAPCRPRKVGRAGPPGRQRRHAQARTRVSLTPRARGKHACVSAGHSVVVHEYKKVTCANGRIVKLGEPLLVDAAKPGAASPCHVRSSLPNVQPGSVRALPDAARGRAASPPAVAHSPHSCAPPFLVLCASGTRSCSAATPSSLPRSAHACRRRTSGFWT